MSEKGTCGAKTNKNMLIFCRFGHDFLEVVQLVNVLYLWKVKLDEWVSYGFPPCELKKEGVSIMACAYFQAT